MYIYLDSLGVISKKPFCYVSLSLKNEMQVCNVSVKWNQLTTLQFTDKCETELEKGASRFRSPKTVTEEIIQGKEMDAVTLNYWLSKFVTEVTKRGKVSPKKYVREVASLKRHL